MTEPIMKSIIEHEHFDMEAFKAELHRLGYDKVLQDNALLGVIVYAMASEICGLQTRITELETFDDPVMLLEHAQMKARIEAAAGILARDLMLPDVSDPKDDARDLGEMTGWNQCREQFRKALGLGDK